MTPTESLTAESGHSEPTVANVRDEEFWFEDGSIILLVQNVEFRIYKGLLTEHSSAFVDLFSLPQPPTHSSCPVVRMSGDSARDWRHILRLYMPRRHTKSVPAAYSHSTAAHTSLPSHSFLDQYPPMLSFEQVAAYVRLSHKYDMPVLYRASLAHLKRHFTDDLRVWVDHGLRPAPGFADIHAIGVVNLARLTHERTLLPTALWMCCRLGPELLSGFAYSDGEVETLGAADVALCWAARPRLVQATLQRSCRSTRRRARRRAARGRWAGTTAGAGGSRRASLLDDQFLVTFPRPRSSQIFTSSAHYSASMQSEVRHSPLQEADERPKIQDDEKFYFDDGTIILSVQGVHFRVHTGILAMHSPIFKDMSTLGSASYQAGDIGGNLDPCPIVELQDSIHDWRHFLRVIYNMKPLMSIGDETYCPTFDELSAYIRLGHKYQMDAFYKPAMNYLECFFSPTLDRWNKWNSRDEPYALPGCAPESAIGIVNLARLTRKESLVPLALLSCCQLGGKLLKGLARPDGTYETLSTGDFERCFNAIPKLTSRGIEQMQLLLIGRPEVSCPNVRMDDDGAACMGGIYDLLEDFQYDSSRCLPIHPTPFVQPDMDVFCEECRDQIHNQCNELNHDTLPRLASFFDL
ncbi:uncharacterized protein BXZ73DRAFT_49926 [Epithele typhae]|uniref:uncharacterized protein n=1 Tax=Epithele typhae TaxID=378194 RepID=UPI0020084D61|nr:uncharacterized protein BXZ73DRAFT_49926 [Epithele typhae]KAH9925695.1 hypothetical protein BXZ73DRAFT_49926 [Epithele typhae]